MYATIESVELQEEANQLAAMILRRRRLNVSATALSVSSKTKKPNKLLPILQK